MKNLVWIASYPKSGNTWVRLLLGAYFADSPEGQFHLLGRSAALRAVFDEWSVEESSDLLAEEIVDLRRTAFELLNNTLRRPVYIKVHDSFSSDFGEACVVDSVTLGVVYLVRNPLDVAVSLSHYLSVSLDRAVDIMCDEKAELARAPHALLHQFPQQLGTWSTHVSGWIRQTRVKVLPIRFEDLHANAAAALASILVFAGEVVQEERVSLAVSATRFDTLRALEAREGFSDSRSSPFFRAGRVGDGVRTLPVHLRERLIDAHGAEMIRWGYL